MQDAHSRRRRGQGPPTKIMRTPTHADIDIHIRTQPGTDTHGPPPREPSIPKVAHSFCNGVPYICAPQNGAPRKAYCLFSPRAFPGRRLYPSSIRVAGVPSFKLLSFRIYILTQIYTFCFLVVLKRNGWKVLLSNRWAQQSHRTYNYAPKVEQNISWMRLVRAHGVQLPHAPAVLTLMVKARAASGIPVWSTIGKQDHTGAVSTKFQLGDRKHQPSPAARTSQPPSSGSLTPRGWAGAERGEMT